MGAGSRPTARLLGSGLIRWRPHAPREPRPPARARAAAARPREHRAPDRAHPGPEHPHRGPLPDRGGGGASLGAAPTLVGEVRGGRVSPAQRGDLPASHQRLGVVKRGAVAHLRPAHRGRGGLPHPQERSLDPSHLAPEGGAGPGAHPGLLPALRAVEDARQWQQSAGLGNSPGTTLEEVGRIQRADVVPP